MIYRALPSDSTRLQSLPESGMGYQVIEARVYGHETKQKFIVYNGQLIIELDDRFLAQKEHIRDQGFLEALRASNSLSIETSSISLIPEFTFVDKRILDSKRIRDRHRYSGGSGAKENPKIGATGLDQFVRLSNYVDDIRIDFEKRILKPGSFATTQDDYKVCVSYNDEPKDRYSLPNDNPILWAYYILPKNGDIVQQGIVQPAFGRDGGGIEAYFVNGTSDNTYLERKPYGQ